MTTSKRHETSIPVNRKELSTLVRKYVRAQSKAHQSNLERLTLMGEILDRAVHIEHARLHVVIHTPGKKKIESKDYKLTDPRAALLLFERLCNVLIPMGTQVCENKCGCRYTIPSPLKGLGPCLLIGCYVNVCPTPRDLHVICVYLCY